MTVEKAVEGEFREHEETGLAIVPPKEIALSTQDPTEFLERAVKQADALKRVIDSKGLAISIGGTKKHVLIDGWQTLMALNGVMPFTVSCTKERDPDGKLTAHVVTEIRRVSDATVLTRVETECSQHENRWARADDYAVISMAQTRGVGKGCRQLFGWVMTLAGFNATPAEEMSESAPSAAAPTLVSPKPTHGVGDGRRVGAAAVGAASHQSEPGSSSAPTPADVAPTTRTANRTGWADEALAVAKQQATHPFDTSGDMSVEQRANVNDLRMKPENEARVMKAQVLLKTWGYDKWAKFLVYGTALQAAEVEEILRGAK